MKNTHDGDRIGITQKVPNPEGRIKTGRLPTGHLGCAAAGEAVPKGNDALAVLVDIENLTWIYIEEDIGDGRQLMAENPHPINQRKNKAAEKIKKKARSTFFESFRLASEHE